MSSIPNISNRIKTRNVKNDVFYTPKDLAIKQINSCLEYVNQNDTWFDPFFGGGVYYDNFPTTNKVWTEISKDRDFFTYTGTCDIICSNPPYSMIEPVLQKSINLKPKIISYLLHNYHISPKRMSVLAENGYYPVHICYVRIVQWFGISVICSFKKIEANQDIPKCKVEWDTTIYKFIDTTV